MASPQPPAGFTPALVEELRDLLHREGQRRAYPCGRIIFGPSSAPRSVYLLETGRVRIFRISEMGDETTFGYVGPQEVFGESAAYADSPRESFAEAVEPSVVWRIPRGAFSRAVTAQPRLSVAVTQQVERRLKRIESRVENLVFHPARQRLARILLELDQDFRSQTKTGAATEVPLTQAELATLVGCTRQTVNAGLHDLEVTGVIRSQRGQIVVLEPEMLAEIAASADAPAKGRPADS